MFEVFKNTTALRNQIGNGNTNGVEVELEGSIFNFILDRTSYSLISWFDNYLKLIFQMSFCVQFLVHLKIFYNSPWVVDFSLRI